MLEMITTISSVSWPPSTSLSYVSEHTDSDNINKNFGPGIANDCKIIYSYISYSLFPLVIREQVTSSTARLDLAESSNIILSDMITDDMLFPTDMLPLLLEYINIR